jgi:hypothetical protein
MPGLHGPAIVMAPAGTTPVGGNEISWPLYSRCPCVRVIETSLVFAGKLENLKLEVLESVLHIRPKNSRIATCSPSRPVEGRLVGRMRHNRPVSISDLPSDGIRRRPVLPQDAVAPRKRMHIIAVSIR